MKALLLAAGLGTRLRPLTWTLPKPMVPLCNRPLVAWAAEALLAEGFDDLVVNLHHRPEAIERFVRDQFGSRASVQFSFEDPILGTGGAIRRVRDRFAPASGLLVVNADTVQWPPLRKMVAALSGDALAALTLRHPPANDRFTSVWFEDDRVTGFGTGTGEALMFSGAHAISPSLLRELPDEDVFGIVDRVYQPRLAAGGILSGVIDDGLWFDIGTPARYLTANQELLAAMTAGFVAVPPGSALRGSSLVEESARVTGGSVGSSIESGSVVEGEVRASVVWDRCVIGSGVQLERCIVASAVELAGPLELRDALICHDDPAIPADVPRRDGLVVLSMRNSGT